VSSYKKVLKDFVVLHYSFHFGTLWNHIILDPELQVSDKTKALLLAKRCLLKIIDKEKEQRFDVSQTEKKRKTQDKRICSICTKEEDEKQSENS